eukprot:NODE_661_length_1447_cov_274.025036_g499_i0.p1 GENE.NODE_661_length_1447_cov_274.025036_g499_i0~~NODE_661_length_1447_cov_274.025036_g499_i0.p1  ORF type:complete len:405 (+),score=90.86 NODE_661_length_1447_cov_274.025036_g499_i0:102-1316(+)
MFSADQEQQLAVRKAYGHKAVKLLNRDPGRTEMEEIEKASKRMVATLREVGHQRELLERAHKQVREFTSYLPPNHINYIEARRNLELQKSKAAALPELQYDPNKLRPVKSAQPQRPKSSPARHLVRDPYSPSAMTYDGESPRPCRPPSGPNSPLSTTLPNKEEFSRLRNYDLEVHTMAAFNKLARLDRINQHRKSEQLRRLNLYAEGARAKNSSKSPNKPKKNVYLHQYTKKANIANVDSVLPRRIVELSDRLHAGNLRPSAEFPSDVRQAALELEHGGKASAPPLTQEDIDDHLAHILYEDVAKREAKHAEVVSRIYGAAPAKTLTPSKIRESVARQHTEEMARREDNQRLLDEKYYPSARETALEDDEMEELMVRLHYSEPQRKEDVLRNAEERSKPAQNAE